MAGVGYNNGVIFLSELLLQTLRVVTISADLLIIGTRQREKITSGLICSPRIRNHGSIDRVSRYSLACSIAYNAVCDTVLNDLFTAILWSVVYTVIVLVVGADLLCQTDI